MDNATLDALFRFPVKGLTAQALDVVETTTSQCFPNDRAYAIENGPSGFDYKAPKHYSKANFLTLMRHERLALLETEFDEETQTLTIKRCGRQLAKGDLSTRIGCNMIEQFFAGFMSEELKGPPRIRSAKQHHFTDVAEPYVHIINLQSVSALERLVNHSINPARFRANIHLGGVEPWAERNWTGKILKIGDVEIEIKYETGRCAAVNVSLQTAKRGLSLPATLAQHFGSSTFGIYGQIISGGRLALGDSVKIN